MNSNISSSSSVVLIMVVIQHSTSIDTKLLENLSLVERTTIFISAGPGKILRHHLLGFIWIRVQFLPVVRLVVNLPIRTQLDKNLLLKLRSITSSKAKLKNRQALLLSLYLLHKISKTKNICVFERGNIIANHLTWKAKSCPRHTQIPEMVQSLSAPNKHMDAKHCFLILSKRWYMPIKKCG